MADYLPSRDEEFQAWAANASALITANPTSYSLVVGDATALAALVTSFTAALSAATNPTTRSPVNVASKDTARAVLTAEIRSLARRVQASPTVTAAQKVALGLTVRDAVPTPTPPPATKPQLVLVETDSRVHVIRLADETTPTRRARPVGAVGAEIFSWVGTSEATPPGDLEQWRFEGQATKAEFTVDYDLADAGKQATIVARWFNRKGEPGPVSNPITGTIAA